MCSLLAIQVAAKKDQEIKKRELELKLAGYSAVKEQGVAAQRKAANIAVRTC